ncbi:GTPase NRas-like isoform X1 [Macrotis lagotis]|uniref:GTPase NRas-like isoform X1 n=2 Tax=Macrotis lagotis TaxID=92651 RepID=UPI003D6814B8
MQAAAESACQDCPPFLSDPLPSGPPRRLSDQLRGLQNRVISRVMAKYKLVVMGSRQVGKSALTLHLVKNCLTWKHDSDLGDTYRTYVVVDGQPCQLDILDTPGSEDHPIRQRHFMHWGQGFLCIYAVDDVKSFVDVQIFREELGRVKGNDYPIPFVLVANKTDVADQPVSRSLGKGMAKSLKVPYMETSAQNRQGVERAFRELVREIRRIQEGITPPGHGWGCGPKPCTILRWSGAGCKCPDRGWHSCGSGGVWLHRGLWSGHP